MSASSLMLTRIVLQCAVCPDGTTYHIPALQTVLSTPFRNDTVLCTCKSTIGQNGSGVFLPCARERPVLVSPSIPGPAPCTVSGACQSFPWQGSMCFKSRVLN